MNRRQGFDTPPPTPYRCRRSLARGLHAVTPILPDPAKRHTTADEESSCGFDRVVTRLLGEFELRPPYHGRFVDVRHPLEIVVYRAPLPLDVTNFALNPFRQARFDVVEQPAGSKRRRFAIVF